MHGLNLARVDFGLSFGDYFLNMLRHWVGWDAILGVKGGFYLIDPSPNSLGNTGKVAGLDKVVQIGKHGFG